MLLEAGADPGNNKGPRDSAPGTGKITVIRKATATRKATAIRRATAIRKAVVRSFLLAIGLLVLPAPSMATTSDQVPRQPAEAKAALLAATCSGCHVKGRSEDGFPSIYGRPAAEIRDLLLSFRSGQREGTVMNRLAKGYDEAEIELLSDYIAAQGTAR